jgi:hypothetical protein
MTGTLFDDIALFGSGPMQVKQFELPDAELTLYEHFFSKEESDQYYLTLLADTP